MRSSGAADLRLKAYRHDDLVLGVFEELVFGPNFQISQPGMRPFASRINIAGADFDAKPRRDQLFSSGLNNFGGIVHSQGG